MHELSPAWIAHNLNDNVIFRILKKVYKDRGAKAGRWNRVTKGSVGMELPPYLFASFQRCVIRDEKTEYRQSTLAVCQVASLCSALHASGDVENAQRLWCKEIVHDGLFADSVSLNEFTNIVNKNVRGWIVRKVSKKDPVMKTPHLTLLQEPQRSSIYSLAILDTDRSGHHAVAAFNGKIYDSNIAHPLRLSLDGLDVVAGEKLFGSIEVAYVLERRQKRKKTPE